MNVPTEHYDYADASVWPTPLLKAHVKDLCVEQRMTEIPRQEAVLERTIGHAVFEMYYRQQETIVTLASNVTVQA